MASSPRRTTITEVARVAGVSLATVSRVMNDNPTVDAALAERVRRTATELGYTANPVARSLVLGRTQTIAVTIPDLANPTFQAILRGLSHAAAADGYHVLIADSAEIVEGERELAMRTRRRTDGIVLCSPRMPQDDLDQSLPELAPAVVINRATALAPTVAADYRTALRDLAEHLITLGHRRIAYLAGSVHSAAAAAREEALMDARAAHPSVDIVEFACGVGFDDGAAAAGVIRGSGATAVLAFNDLVAMGLLSALTAAGVRVPQDISVAGFDDIPFAAYTVPPLTTAAVPAADLGARAWIAMRALLEGEEATPSQVDTPHVIVRASTAAPAL